MGSCAVFLFFVFLRFIILSEQDCNDQFVIGDEIAKTMTELIPLANCSSLEETLKCTVWINKDRDFLKNVTSECFDEEDPDLGKNCPNITAESDKIYMLHFRCLFAKVRNVNYSDKVIKSVFEDCQHFISGIDTIRRLWNTSDNNGASAETTSISPKTMSNTSSPTTPSTPSSMTTSNSSWKTTFTRSSQSSSMSAKPMLKSHSITTSTSSQTTKLTSPQETTSTKFQTTTSRSSLTTQSTGKTQLSNTATPKDLNLSVASPSNSASHADQITNSPSQTPDPPITWPTAFVLVLLLLSVVVNIMQWLNSFQQKWRLNVKQKAMNTECISLNEDATAAEKSPEESVTYSNETVY